MEENTTPEEQYSARPMYGLPDEDYSPKPQVYTVTVAGRERHDGEAPYVYVVSDHSRELAWIQALRWHMANQETIDAYVVAGESHDGPPPPDAGFTWNDLRPEQELLEALESVAREAKTLAVEYQAAIKRYQVNPEGEQPQDAEIAEDSIRQYDETRTGFGLAALGLLQQLADVVARAEQASA